MDPLLTYLRQSTWLRVWPVHVSRFGDSRYPRWHVQLKLPSRLSHRPCWQVPATSAHSSTSNTHQHLMFDEHDDPQSHASHYQHKSGLDTCATRSPDSVPLRTSEDSLMLSQRGHAMLPLCLVSTDLRAQSFLISYWGFRFTSAYNQIMFCCPRWGFLS